MNHMGEYFILMPYLLIGFVIAMFAKNAGCNKAVRLVCLLFWPVVIVGCAIAFIAMGIIELFKD